MLHPRAPNTPSDLVAQVLPQRQWCQLRHSQQQKTRPCAPPRTLRLRSRKRMRLQCLVSACRRLRCSGCASCSSAGLRSVSLCHLLTDAH